jgi:glycogen(starch) synthase
MRALCANEARRAAELSALEFGLEWFPDGIGGGCSRFFSAISDHLETERVAVHGVVTGRTSMVARQCEGIRIVSAYDAPLAERLWNVRGAVREILESERVDVVASHFALFTFACLDLVKHLPLIVHFHGPWAAEARVEGRSRFVVLSKLFIERAVYARARKAIVLTRAFRDVLHRCYGVPEHDIAVIPGGVDVGRYHAARSRADARMYLRLPLDRPIIVAVRRLAKRMGLEHLIAAFAEIRREHRDALLVIVGGGHLFRLLERMVEEYGLRGNVVLTGRVSEDDLPWYYRAADLSIVPSVALEGFGLVVAESLACGTPALVTPVGGLPEVVAGLSEHLILENSSAPAIADGLREALSGRRGLPTDQECSAYARAHFSWPTIAKQVKSVYAEVLCSSQC